MIDYIASWRSRLRSRIWVQFRGTNVEVLSDILAKRFQEVEDMLQSLLTLASIDDSVGAQLQNLGRIVGQPWNGEDDATYRLLIRARIRVNLSSGNAEKMYPVFLAMFGITGTGQAWIFRRAGDVATMVFRVLVRPMTPSEATILFGLLTAASVGGVRLILEWPSADPAHGFCFDDGSGSGGPGLGWGDIAHPATGGSLSGALSS